MGEGRARENRVARGRQEERKRQDFGDQKVRPVPAGARGEVRGKMGRVRRAFNAGRRHRLGS